MTFKPDENTPLKYHLPAQYTAPANETHYFEFYRHGVTIERRPFQMDRPADIWRLRQAARTVFDETRPSGVYAVRVVTQRGEIICIASEHNLLQELAEELGEPGVTVNVTRVARQRGLIAIEA
jgi:hypothetical protein